MKTVSPGVLIQLIEVGKLLVCGPHFEAIALVKLLLEHLWNTHGCSQSPGTFCMPGVTLTFT